MTTLRWKEIDGKWGLTETDGWVGLTDQEKYALIDVWNTGTGGMKGFAEKIEAKLREKNT